jgi:hypothetical protein
MYGCAALRLSLVQEAVPVPGRCGRQYVPVSDTCCIQWRHCQAGANEAEIAKPAAQVDAVITNVLHFGVVSLRRHIAMIDAEV